MIKAVTTLRLLKEKKACSDGFETLIKHLGEDYDQDCEINLLTILKSNGVNHCLWAFRATILDCSREARLIAADCAESVLYIYTKKYTNDDRPKKSIETARKIANKEIVSVSAASAAAYDAASAASAAAYADAAYAAADAAYSAAAAAAAADASAYAADAAADASAYAAYSAAAAAAAAAYADAAYAAAYADYSAAAAAAAASAREKEINKQIEIIKKYLCE